MRREAAAGPSALCARSETPADVGPLRLHASCVRLGGKGVALLGRSGCGKSDLALRLIDVGAILVADDQIIVERADARLLARPVEGFAGLLEVRGVGILRLPSCGPCQLDLLVDLDPAAPIPRLPEPTTRELLGVALPCLRIDARAPSAAAAVKLSLVAERLA